MNCAVNSPTGNIDARNQIHLYKKVFISMRYNIKMINPIKNDQHWYFGYFHAYGVAVNQNQTRNICPMFTIFLDLLVKWNAFNCTLLIDETHILFGTCICDPVVSMLLLNFKCIDDDHIKILACDLDNYSWSYSRFIVSPFRIVEKDGKE